MEREQRRYQPRKRRDNHQVTASGLDSKLQRGRKNWKKKIDEGKKKKRGRRMMSVVKHNASICFETSLHLFPSLSLSLCNFLLFFLSLTLANIHSFSIRALSRPSPVIRDKDTQPLIQSFIFIRAHFSIFLLSLFLSLFNVFSLLYSMREKERYIKIETQYNRCKPARF